MDETRAGEVRSSVIQGKTTGRPPSRARARHINQDHMSGVDGRTSPATASAKRGRAAGGHPPPKCRHQPARGRVAWIATRGGRGTHHQPQAAAGPLFLFFGPLAVDRQSVQYRRAPTTAGTGTRRLPAYRVMPRRFHHTLAAGSGGTATFLMARRIAGRTTDPCTRRRCRPFMPCLGEERTTEHGRLAGTSLPTRIFGTVLP
jgi:hypothetical protein